MEDKNKIKLFWKIVDLINRKFCENKLVIHEIVLIERRKKSRGYYRNRDRIIGIKKNRLLIDQIKTLVHEISHAYQHQILKKYYNQKISKNKGIGIKVIFHDSVLKRIYKKFLKEVDDNLGYNLNYSKGESSKVSKTTKK